MPRQKKILTQQERSVVLSSIIQRACLNGASDRNPLLFKDLTEEGRKAYIRLAKKEGQQVETMYTSCGERIVLNGLQHFIIMILQEMYNEQVENNSFMGSKDFYVDFTGSKGHLKTNAHMIARWITGKDNPSGKTVNKISQAIFDLAESKECRGMMLYQAYDYKEKKPIMIAMHDNPISWGFACDKEDPENSTEDKPETSDEEKKKSPGRNVTGVIKLHDAFVSNIKNGYILSKPVTKAILKFTGNRIPTLSTQIFIRLLQEAGGRKTFDFIISAPLLKTYLTCKYQKRRQDGNFEKKLTYAIDCAKSVGILQNVEEGTTLRGEKSYTFHIDTEFFPQKKELSAVI